MKTINRDRTTNSFCIHGYTVRDLAIIAAHYGTDLIAVAVDKEDQTRSTYRVRVMVGGGLIDKTVRIDWNKNVQETERVTIVPAGLGA